MPGSDPIPCRVAIRDCKDHHYASSKVKELVIVRMVFRYLSEGPENWVRTSILFCKCCVLGAIPMIFDGVFPKQD